LTRIEDFPSFNSSIQPISDAQQYCTDARSGRPQKARMLININLALPVFCDPNMKSDDPWRMRQSHLFGWLKPSYVSPIKGEENGYS
jgi:hypothetical protein